MSPSRKRARDDEEDDYEELSRGTKQCILPFRVSPTLRHNRGFSQASRNKPAPIFTQPITPADSSEEETSPPFSSAQSCNLQMFTQLGMSSTATSVEQNQDMDMDMTDTQPLGSPRYLGQRSALPSPRASPGTLISSHPTFRNPFKDCLNTASGGRMPTPIYGHFQQNLDAKMEVGEDPETVISRTQQEIDYEKYVRRRRLPTPIDEDEVMDSSVVLDSVTEPEHYHGNHSTKASWAPLSASFNAPARATRLSFSMGIRADCDLCRMKVPGHSNHIFRT